MDKVTVFCLNYNGKEVLPKCIESIKNQVVNGFELEVIILDNASTDGSNKLFPEIETVNLDNSHKFITGLNAVRKYGSGCYKMFLENDVWLHRNCILRLYESMKENQCKIVQPIIYSESSQIMHAGMKFQWPGYGLCNGILNPPEVFATTCFMTTQDVLTMVGEFDENLAPAYYEDVDYSIRAKKLGVKLEVVPLATAYHKANFSFSKVMKKREISDLCHKNRKYVVNKHFKGLDRLLRLTVIEALDATVRPMLYDHN